MVKKILEAIILVLILCGCAVIPQKTETPEILDLSPETPGEEEEAVPQTPLPTEEEDLVFTPTITLKEDLEVIQLTFDENPR